MTSLGSDKGKLAESGAMAALYSEEELCDLVSQDTFQGANVVIKDNAFDDLMEEIVANCCQLRQRIRYVCMLCLMRDDTCDRQTCRACRLTPSRTNSLLPNLI